MADAKITYKSGVIAEINGGQTATLKCKGMKMDDDVTVESLGSTGGTDERFKQLVEGTLTEIDDSEITQVYTGAFQKQYNLVSVNLPNVTSIAADGFANCSALTQVNLPNVKTLLERVFTYCSNLEEITLPLPTSVGQGCFSSCSKLKKVDLPNYLFFSSNYIFNGCNSLTALILRRSDKICTLSGTYTFSGCYHFVGTVNATYNPEGLKDGYIYVPSALIEEYKVATNWVTFADQFRALEDYTVDGTTTGELDWEKVNA